MEPRWVNFPGSDRDLDAGQGRQIGGGVAHSHGKRLQTQARRVGRRDKWRKLAGAYAGIVQVGGALLQ